MGYCTSYDGKIQITTEQGKRFVQTVLQKDNSDDHGTLSLFYSKFDEKNSVLRMSEDAKFYDDEIERVLCLLAKFDKGAHGIIDSEGEDGEGKKRFTLSKGKLYCEEGYVAYKEKKDITDDYDDTDSLDEIKETMNRFAVAVKCDKCNSTIDLMSFDFSKRGYYEEAKGKTGFKNLDEKCYRAVKKTLLEIAALDKKKAELTAVLPKKKGD